MSRLEGFGEAVRSETAKEPRAPDRVVRRAAVLARRRRRRRLLLGSGALLVSLGVVFSIFGRVDSPGTVDVATSGDLVAYENSEFGVAVEYPNTWQLAEESLTPVLEGTGVGQVLAVTTVEPISGGVSCAQWPGRTMARLGSDDALLFLFLLPETSAAVATNPWDPSDATIPTEPIANSDIGTCVTGDPNKQPPINYDVTTFVEDGVGYGLLLAVGNDLSEARAAEVTHIVDSITFGGATRDDARFRQDLVGLVTVLARELRQSGDVDVVGQDLQADPAPWVFKVDLEDDGATFFATATPFPGGMYSVSIMEPDRGLAMSVFLVGYEESGDLAVLEKSLHRASPGDPVILRGDRGE